ncbi:MAG: hypothetical protein U0237_16375 [Thermoleophilia bacterium]
MQRTLPAVLAALLCASVIAGCGGQTPARDPDPPGPVRVAALAVNPARPAIAPGESLRLMAVTRATDGSVADVTAGGRWRVTGAAVRLTGPGRLRAVAPGTAVVEVRAAGRRAAARVTVDPRASGALVFTPSRPFPQDPLGRSIALAGSHTWTNLMDSGTTDPPPAFDKDRYLDTLQVHGQNLTRLWTWEQARWTAETREDYHFSPTVFVRTGPGTGADGGLRFDLQRVNPAYLARVRERVRAARERGIWTVVMLFDGWSVAPKVSDDMNPWRGHPLNAANNVNGIDGDTDGNGDGTDTQTLVDPAVTAVQERYVRAVVAELAAEPNVMYEISNESDGSSVAWQEHMVGVIRDAERDGPLRHPVGMTFPYPGGDDDVLLTGPADWVSPGGDPSDPRPVGERPVIMDTDHLCGVCGDASFPWRAFTRGNNPLFMDLYDDTAIGLGALDGDGTDPEWERLRRALGIVREVSEQVDLSRMRPDGSFASSGFALTTGGARPQAVVLATGGDRVTLDLREATGRFAVRWVHPRSGVVLARTIANGGGKVSLDPPIDADAVLILDPA